MAIDRDLTAAELLAGWAAMVAATPADAIAHYNYAVACDQAGDRQAAIAALRESLALNPSYGPAHFNLGSRLLEAGEVAAAVAAFREAVRVAPEQPFGHFMLGTAYLAAGEYRLSYLATVAGLRLAPDPRAEANAGRAAFLLGCYTDAALRYLVAVDLDGDNWGLLLCLGTAVCRHTGVAELKLAPGPEQTTFGLEEPEDLARFAKALWSLEADDSAREQCLRLTELDAELGRRVSAVIETGGELQSRLWSLFEQAKSDPEFVALEVQSQ